MGLRFRRRIKIIPGLYVNVSKSGLSFSAGVRGASVTFGGKGGTYLNAGIPGTGIYTRQKINDGFSSPEEETEETEIDLEKITSDLNEEELEMFNNSYRKRKKSVLIGVVLTLFPLGFGFHKFYLGANKAGWLYLLFCWTFIPIFIQLIEVFFMGKIIEVKNLDIAQQIVEDIRK